MLTVLASIWIALGAMFTLISLGVATMVLLFPGSFAPRLPEGPDAAEISDMVVIDWLFAHFELLCVFQLLVAMAILVGGIFLLKQRAWARTLLETIFWLGITYTISFTAWFIHQWLSTTAAVASDAPADAEQTIFRVFGVGIALLSVLFYGGPLGVLIWRLRHRTVRGALGRTGTPPGDGPPGA